MRGIRTQEIEAIRRALPWYTQPYTPLTKGNESYPWNYQWYLQQIAQNKGDKLYSTQRGIREANGFGGLPSAMTYCIPSHPVW